MIRFEVQQRGLHDGKWFSNGAVHGFTRREAYDQALALLTYHKGVRWHGPIALRLHPRIPTAAQPYVHTREQS